MIFSEAFVDFAAGWCSGAAAVIACQPIDTILTRKQAGISLIVGSIRPRELVEFAGFRSLWRGSVAMIGAVPFQNALLMAGYGLGKRYGSGTDKDGRNGDGRSGVFVGGVVGGIAQSFLMSPVELIKVHQQVDVVGKESLSARIVQISGGVGNSKALLTTVPWRGLGATLLRDGIPHGVWFVSYEIAKDYLSLRWGKRHDMLATPIVSGAFAATIAWGVGYPFDMIKTRIQAGGKLGILGTAKELIGEPGGLYRGFGLKLVRSVPASMIGFCVYETVKARLSPSD